MKVNKWVLVSIAVLFAVVGLLIGTCTAANALSASAQDPSDRDALIPPGAIELIERRIDGGLHFQDGRGQTVAVLGEDIHFQGQAVDTAFRRQGGRDSIGNAPVSVLRDGPNLTIRDTLNPGRGITWHLPTSNVANRGHSLAYTSNGLEWEYTAHPRGIKLEAEVTEARGVQAYSFPYTAIGGPLTLDRDGNAVGDGFHIPPPIVIDANGDMHAYEWTLSGGALSFSFNDAGLALPYVIDPSTTFTAPLSSTDFGHTNASGGSWAPSCSSVTTAGTNLTIRKSFAGGNYLVNVAPMLWDTSSIPDTAEVTAAEFRFFVSQLGNADGLNLEGNYYAVGNWPITCGDHTNGSVGTNALSTALSGLSTGSYQTMALSNVSNINLTGNTGLRFGLSGGQPSGSNFLVGNGSGNANNRPLLVVTYTEMEVNTAAPDEVAANGTKSFTVTGVLLTGTTAVRLEKAGESNINCSSIVVNSDTEITFDCNMTGAAGGLWNVRVTKSSGSEVGTNLIDVRALSVDSVTPVTATPTGVESITITGDGFDTGMSCQLEMSGESNIVGSSLVVVSFTEATGDFDLSGVEPGHWNMRCTNSPSSADDLMPNALYVSTLISLLITDVDPGEYTLTLTGDSGTGYTLRLDNVIRDTHGTAVEIENTSDPWELFAGLPYVNSFEYVLDGQQAIHYEIDYLPGLLLQDRSGQGNHTIARYPDTVAGITSQVLPMESTGLPVVSAPGGGQFGPEMGELDNLIGTEHENPPGNLVFAFLEWTGLKYDTPYQAMLIMAGFVGCSVLGLISYGAFRSTHVMYAVMLGTAVAGTQIGDGIWGWVVPITFGVAGLVYVIYKAISK